MSRVDAFANTINSHDLRPNLNVTKQEINDALNKISKSF